MDCESDGGWQRRFGRLLPCREAVRPMPFPRTIDAWSNGKLCFIGIVTIKKLSLNYSLKPT